MKLKYDQTIKIRCTADELATWKKGSVSPPGATLLSHWIRDTLNSAARERIATEEKFEAIMQRREQRLRELMGADQEAR